MFCCQNLGTCTAAALTPAGGPLAASGHGVLSPSGLHPTGCWRGASQERRCTHTWKGRNLTAKISAPCTSSSRFRQNWGASLGRVGVGELVLPRRGKRDRREAGSGFEPRINGIESDPTIRAFCNKRTAERTALSLRLDRCTVLMTVLARIWEGAFSNAMVGLAVR